MKTLRHRFFELVLLSLAAGPAAPGCENPEPADGEEDLRPADFYLTVKLATNFRPQAVDQLEVVMYDSTMVLLDELNDEHYDGGVTWETRDGPRGDEFVVRLTGEFFQNNAMEVSQDTFEIDIPFIVPERWDGDPPEPSAFSVTATAYWEDYDGVLQEIGRGTGELELPQEGRNPTTIEVICDGDWAWTCRTACDPAASQCTSGVEECGTGSWDCIDECCVPQ